MGLGGSLALPYGYWGRTMTKDVDEMVLNVFRVEHREQLEQIRTLLGGAARRGGRSAGCPSSGRLPAGP